MLARVQSIFENASLSIFGPKGPLHPSAYSKLNPVMSYTKDHWILNVICHEENGMTELAVEGFLKNGQAINKTITLDRDPKDSENPYRVKTADIMEMHTKYYSKTYIVNGDKGRKFLEEIEKILTKNAAKVSTSPRIQDGKLQDIHIAPYEFKAHNLQSASYQFVVANVLSVHPCAVVHESVDDFKKHAQVNFKTPTLKRS